MQGCPYLYHRLPVAGVDGAHHHRAPPHPMDVFEDPAGMLDIEAAPVAAMVLGQLQAAGVVEGHHRDARRTEVIAWRQELFAQRVDVPVTDLDLTVAPGLEAEQPELTGQTPRPDSCAGSCNRLLRA